MKTMYAYRQIFTQSQQHRSFRYHCRYCKASALRFVARIKCRIYRICRNYRIAFCSGLFVSACFLPSAGFVVSASDTNHHGLSVPKKVSFYELAVHTLDYHPAVQSQTFKLESSTQNVAAAKQAFWPTPSVSVERALERNRNGDLRGDATTTVLGIQQPLYTGGRLSAQLSRAEAEVQFTAAELADIEQSLLLRLIQAWSEWFVAEQKLDAVATSRETHIRLLDMVSRRSNEGVSAVADVALAESRIGMLDAELLLLRAQQQSALEQLSSLVGVNISQVPLSREITLPEFTQPLEYLINLAEERTPSVLMARSQAEIAATEINLAKSQLSPEVYVRFEHQKGSFNLPGGRTNNAVYVGISSSFGPGLSSFSRVSGAAANFSAAEQDIATQLRAVAEQVRLNSALLAAANIRLKSLATAKRASADVLASYERQFLAGRKQWLDLMNAAREQAQTATQIADARGAMHSSALKLTLFTMGAEAFVNAAEGTYE